MDFIFVLSLVGKKQKLMTGVVSVFEIEPFSQNLKNRNKKKATRVYVGVIVIKCCMDEVILVVVRVASLLQRPPGNGEFAIKTRHFRLYTATSHSLRQKSTRMQQQKSVEISHKLFNFAAPKAKCYKAKKQSMGGYVAVRQFVLDHR